MKRAAIIASILSLVVVAGLAWHMRNQYLIHSQQFQAEQAQRDAGYAALLRQYQHDLRAGTTREEVETYLRSHQIEYGSANDQNGTPDTLADVVIVKIGEEPASGFPCDRWWVYVEFYFVLPLRDAEIKPALGTTSSDRLKEIRISKIGHCL